MKNFIDIQYENKEYQKIIKMGDIKKWMIKLLNELNINNSSCSVLFATTKKIQYMNCKYLNNDYPTDVLAFSQIEGEKSNFTNINFLGDIVICIPQAIKQSKDRKHSTILEVYFLLLHGLLHLLGYDHEQDIDKKREMNILQKNIFNKLTGERVE